MLKKVTFFIVALILFKPLYDLGTSVYDEAVTIFNENQETISVSHGLDILEENLIENHSSPVSLTNNEKGTLPNIAQNVEDLEETFYYYFSNWQTDFEIHYVGSTRELDKLIEKAAENAAERNQYILGHLSDRKIEYEYSSMQAKIKVHQQYLTSDKQEQIVDQKVKDILSSIEPNTMTDFEKVKFVNDYIVKNTAYGTETASVSPHSACAIVTEGKGVCQGYALFALKMLQALGVESKYVVGEVYSGGHAWNLVKVDGQWYHLDTTWNDPTPDRPNVVSYKYFLVNDEKMKLDHSWNQSDYPQATSSKYAFMEKIDNAYELNGYIYYSNVDDDHRLYQMNLQTGESKRITKSRAQYIVGFGDWLYYSNYSNGAYLTKIKTNGTEEETIYREEVKDLYIENGYLYFSTSNGPKKIPL